MANAFTQLHVQIVLVVKYRQSLIHESWEERLYKFIWGLLQKKGHKPLQINGMPDHIHIFFGLNPASSISELVREIKKSTNRFINGSKLASSRFSWQSGYGAFTYCKREVKIVIRYIKRQKEHHRKQSTRNEFLSLLKDYELDYDEKYMFQFIE